MTLVDHFDGVIEEGERGEAQEIHLEQAEFIEPVHVVLGDNFVAVGLVERDDGAQGDWREMTTPAA